MDAEAETQARVRALVQKLRGCAGPVIEGPRRNQWHYEMKAHIGVDAEPGLVLMFALGNLGLVRKTNLQRAQA